MERTGDDWRSKAECRKVDPELFFPIGETSPIDKQQVKDALAVCAMCQVTEQCLDYALTTNQTDGVWGGLSGKQRRAYKRRATILRRRAE
ncbi:WhiB family transcriptional regulator [Candidatus Saccharibacteria bacterium]|nr:WhiB family transcriptional regulator [Candidatus Saccharibacteria bacterium]